MIAALNGEVLEKQEGSLIVDVNGVGYLVSVTSVVAERAVTGEKIKLQIYTDVRETAIALYGFDAAIEREVFLLLKKVKGIGAHLALTIISFIGAEAVLSCIGQEDVDALKKVPGVGKKTAERVIVELREAVVGLLPTANLAQRPVVVPKASIASDLSSIEFDAVLALEKLGFRHEQAREAVAATLESSADLKLRKDAGELLKAALAYL